MNKIAHFVVALMLIACSSASFAQGKIEVVKDFEFDLLLNQKRIKADSSEMKGYRIQIYFGTDRNDCENVAEEFKSTYPELRDQVYMSYTQPYWRVRVGNYYRPIDAQKDMHLYQDDFPKIFLIKDEIELPRIGG